eukprot:CAMPEP_0172430330 /NCGR_PEP_ID=MMETSP1064-20121228/54002_1 /TAXON_ID=202472 /ORGANISM="Aulacoseira subarctica , Strain CCAP 1002/5" /LENGTH=33 /DNA_ID= /DNA_START= /DNA_END= /DNA_ORIENTATION=
MPTSDLYEALSEFISNVVISSLDLEFMRCRKKK